METDANEEASVGDTVTRSHTATGGPTCHAASLSTLGRLTGGDVAPPLKERRQKSGRSRSPISAGRSMAHMLKGLTLETATNGGAGPIVTRRSEGTRDSIREMPSLLEMVTPMLPHLETLDLIPVIR